MSNNYIVNANTSTKQRFFDALLSSVIENITTWRLAALFGKVTSCKLVDR
jgi:hypothetical protein